MAKSKLRDKIKLVSTAGTGFFYTTTKNKRNTPDKFVMNKYDPVIRKHCEFKEAKIKQAALDVKKTAIVRWRFFCGWVFCVVDGRWFGDAA